MYITVDMAIKKDNVESSIKKVSYFLVFSFENFIYIYKGYKYIQSIDIYKFTSECHSHTTPFLERR